MSGRKILILDEEEGNLKRCEEREGRNERLKNLRIKNKGKEDIIELGKKKGKDLRKRIEKMSESKLGERKINGVRIKEGEKKFIKKELRKEERIKNE